MSDDPSFVALNAAVAELVTVTETARILGIHFLSVHRLIRKGVIPVTGKIWRKSYIRKDWVLEFKKTYDPSPHRHAKKEKDEKGA